MIAIFLPRGGELGKIALITCPQHGGQINLFASERIDCKFSPKWDRSFRPSRARLGVVDRLFCVGAADDLARGQSTFMVEMVETAAILNQATAHHWLFSTRSVAGLSTFDGFSIAWATVEHLHSANRARTLFATHFHELTQLAKTLPRLVNLTCG